MFFFKKLMLLLLVCSCFYQNAFAGGKSDENIRPIENLIKEGTLSEIKQRMKNDKYAITYKTQDDIEDNVLNMAIKNGRGKDIVMYLMSSGIGPTEKNARGQNAIMYMCMYSNDAELLDDVIKYGTIFKIGTKHRVLVEDKEGMTAFDYANDKPEMIHALEKYAARPPVKAALHTENKDKTAATQTNKTDGASKTDSDIASDTKTNGMYGLNGEGAHDAASSEEIINMHKYEPAYLFDADYSNDTGEVPLLSSVNTSADKKSTYDVDSPDKNGMTLLMKASKDGKFKEAEQLIAQGAAINATDNDGWTSLMYSVRFSDSAQTVSLLIQNGADVHAMNKYGTTPLMMATMFSSSASIIKALLQNRSPIEEEIRESFITAIKSQQSTSIIKSFIEHGLMLDVLYSGMTPLMYAASTNTDTDIIALLLKSGANTKVLSASKKTAFDYAAENSRLPHNDVYFSLGT